MLLACSHTASGNWKQVSGLQKVKVLGVRSCLTLCDRMNCSPPVSSVHGIFQVRILEWVAISYSRCSSWPKDRMHICVSCIGNHILYQLPHLGSPSSPMALCKCTPANTCAPWHMKGVQKTVHPSFYQPNTEPEECLWLAHYVIHIVRPGFKPSPDYSIKYNLKI